MTDQPSTMNHETSIKKSTGPETFEKLKDFKEVKFEDLKVGDHIRYTCNEYEKETRKCVYAIITALEPQLKVRGYKSTYKPWIIDITNPYKDFRLYRKPAK